LISKTSKKEKKLPSYLSPDTQTRINTAGCTGCDIEIRVKGLLSEVWSDWFEGLTIERKDNGEMVLSGNIVDQSALMGVLNKLNRLNLTILSLNEVKNKNQKEKK
jgi:hypothetical protein